MNRREFVTRSAAGVAASTLSASVLRAVQAGKLNPHAIENGPESIQNPLTGFVPNRIGVSTYSFWRFRKDSKLTMTKCIDLFAGG